MYADRFAAPRRYSPGAIGAAVAINGAVLAALIFSAPEMVPIPSWDPPIHLIPVVPDPPPPPPRPIQHPKTKTLVSDPIPNDADLVVPKAPIEPLARGPEIDIAPRFDDGGGTTIALDPPRPTPPVMVGAEPDPRFARDLQPPYPPGARREEREGRVTVRVLVGTDGRVKTLEALGGGDSDFLDATRRQALAHWRFKPATRDGIPYESWRVMTVRFVLDN